MVMEYVIKINKKKLNNKCVEVIKINKKKLSNEMCREANNKRRMNIKLQGIWLEKLTSCATWTVL